MILLLACTATHPDSTDSEPVPLDSDPHRIDSAPPACDALTCEGGLCWQGFCDGSFEMGSPEGEGEPYEWPVHTVRVLPFEILQTEITVASYGACVEAGACELWPASGDTPDSCNQWDPDPVQEHPQNCMDWHMAADFCFWAGGRLPSEAEWEYAARSGGQEGKTYPWGEAEPDCDLANVKGDSADCGTHTEPVCSHPAGHTEQGLCDMGGNVYEWVADYFHNSYEGAPTDSLPWQDPATEFKTMRGSGVGSGEDLRTRNRTFHEPPFSYGGMGARCVRPGEEPDQRRAR
jgi:formylglycine-generating enzyme required for sulfatase activity